MPILPISQGLLRNLNQQSDALQSLVEKLSSQNELARSGEYPSERARAETLESSLHSNQAIARNVGDAKTLIQVTEAGLNETHNLLTRMKELALQGSNEWISADEREILDKEAYQLKQEIERIALTTQYRNQYLLNGEGKDYTFQIGSQNDESSRLTFSSAELDSRASSLGIDGVDLTSADSSLDAISDINEAMQKAQRSRSITGSFHSRLDSVERLYQTTEEIQSAQLSRLRDVDVAKASTELVKKRVQLEASIALLSQSHNLQRSTLKLLDF